MKKVLLLNAMLLLSTCMFAQTLKKGSLLGLHKGTVTLSPNVTMEQFKNYYFNVYAAEFAKLFKVKLVEVTGVRGEYAKKNDNDMAMLFIFEPKAREKYFETEGKLNAQGNELFAKLKTYSDEVNKLGKFTSTYTDWEIQ
jgi:hypothetical protein